MEKSENPSDRATPELVTEQTSSAKRFLTPEEQKERIEKIKKKIIDIRHYRGLVHGTQLAALTGILKEGLSSGKRKDGAEKEVTNKRRWGYGGELGFYASGDRLHLSAISRDGVFSTWDRSEGGSAGIWRDAGPLFLIFDSREIPDIPTMNSVKVRGWDAAENKLIEELSRLNLIKPGADYTKTLSLPQLTYLANEGFTFSEIEIETPNAFIPSEAVEGVILSPATYRLERKDFEMQGEFNADYDRHIKEDFLTTTPEQALIIAKNRLQRSLKDPESNPVPLYDHNGNVLWPEIIPLEKVREMVAEHEKGSE